MGKRELIALLNLSSWCLMMVERLFLAVPQGGLQFVIVVFPDHTHLLFLLKFQIFFEVLKRHSPSVLYISEATESLRYHIFALDSVVIIQKLLSSHGGFLTYAIYHKNGIYMLKITQIYMCLII